VQYLQEMHKPNGCRIGILGLGAGTLACYARRSDAIDFFEINPLVRDFAEHHFSFLHDARERGASVDVRLGDARRLLNDMRRRNQSGSYDLLVADAFSGDSIPLHLMTRECFELYRYHLQPEGILAVHVTNRHVDLQPVARQAAEWQNWTAVRIQRRPAPTDRDFGIRGASNWILMTKNRRFCDHPTTARLQSAWTSKDRPPQGWTDELSSVFPLLR
jgi:hypothetical protein